MSCSPPSCKKKDGSGRADVLILTASVGAGHNQAAKAVKVALEQRDSELNIQWMDVLTETSRFFTLLYKGGYARMVSHLPKIYGAGYKFWDSPQHAYRPPMELLRLFCESISLRKVIEHIRRTRPRIILHTHFLAPAIIGRLKDFDQLDTIQMAVVTDYVLHRFWYAENMAHYFVPSQSGLDRLKSFGIAENKITFSGIPVHSRWYDLPSAESIRANWNIPADRHVVTVTAGADFTLGNVYKLVKHLLADRSDLEVIALAGANKNLLKDLAKIAAGNPRLHSYGFTDKINEIIAMSDLVLTKSGGLMTTECLTAGKPMVFFPPLPGQEAGNAVHLSRCGAALVSNDINEMLKMTENLLDSETALTKMALAAKALRKNSAGIITDSIIKQLGKS